MCDISCEPCEAYARAWRTARKPHVCDACGGRIAKGERYERHSGIFEGDPFSFACCAACELVLKAFGDVHDARPTPNWLFRALLDCVEGAHKTDPEVRRWRDAMASMRWRERARLRESVVFQRVTT